jgi:hypothetical protein
MTDHSPSPDAVQEFIQRWETSGAAERAALASYAGAATPEQLAKSFSRAKTDRISELLETLASLGQVREVEAGRYIVQGRRYV